jgi:hypothetical protein
MIIVPIVAVVGDKHLVRKNLAALPAAAE